MQLAVVADSHIPGRANGIPVDFNERIRAADHVVHAGDFTSPEALDDFRALSHELTAVYGNMDPRDLDLPPVSTLSIEGVTFLVTHGTGPPRSYEDRVAELVRREGGAGAVGIAGHTHEVLDAEIDGVRLLNPGSVTGAAPADRATMMTLDVRGGEAGVTVHALDR
jgi:putative phosphoesterase